MTRFLYKFAKVFALAQIHQGAASGCIILPASPLVVAERIERSSHVFYGTVVEVFDDRSRSTVTVRFTVDVVYKGFLAGTATVQAVRGTQLNCIWWTPRIGDQDVFFVTTGVRDDPDLRLVHRQSGLDGNRAMLREALDHVKRNGSPQR